jgi:hypothetical protein
MLNRSSLSCFHERADYPIAPDRTLTIALAKIKVSQCSPKQKGRENPPLRNVEIKTYFAMQVSAVSGVQTSRPV